MCVYTTCKKEGLHVIWNKLGLCQRGGGMKEKETMKHAVLIIPSSPVGVAKWILFFGGRSS